MKQILPLVPLLFCVSALCHQSRADEVKSVQVRVHRWLEVTQLAGTVTYQAPQQSSEPARKGMRLQSVGDTLRTGNGSSAVLQVDTDIGTVNISANTTVRVQQLQLMPNGGRVTRLQVTGGQARFRVRKFNHPGSSLEIETPAGSSAVRGTEFGVSVHPDGKTGIATREGRILVEAQNQSLLVEAGQEVLLIPGLPPPGEPKPLTPLPQFNLRLLSTLDDQTVRIVAQVDPLNLVKIAGLPQILTHDGQIDVTVPLPPDRRIQVIAIAPIGLQQVYELAVP
ncbi:MAG: FecR domain-containing protein [Desertifilum sp. SIO1I2]|nr:FecR domain-containing protein [Desertifilum sp. SIO1I2]